MCINEHKYISTGNKMRIQNLKNISLKKKLNLIPNLNVNGNIALRPAGQTRLSLQCSIDSNNKTIN